MRQDSQTIEHTRADREWVSLQKLLYEGVPASLSSLSENLRRRVSAPFNSLPQTKTAWKSLLAGPGRRDAGSGPDRGAPSGLSARFPFFRKCGILPACLILEGKDSMGFRRQKVAFVCNVWRSKGVLTSQAVSRRIGAVAAIRSSVHAAVAGDCVLTGGFTDMRRPPGRRGLTSLVRWWAYL